MLQLSAKVADRRRDMRPCNNEASSMDIAVLRRTFTIDEFHRMAEAGVFREDDRLELLDGEIVQMTAVGGPPPPFLPPPHPFP